GRPDGLVIASVTRYAWFDASPAGAGVGFLLDVIDGGDVGVDVGAADAPPVEAVGAPDDPDPPLDVPPAVVVEPEPDVVVVLAVVDWPEPRCENGSRPWPGSLDRPGFDWTFNAGREVAPGGGATDGAEATGVRFADFDSAMGTATIATRSTSTSGHRRLLRSWSPSFSNTALGFVVSSLISRTSEHRRRRRGAGARCRHGLRAGARRSG